MKKTETKFFCDDCGKLLPDDFVIKNGDKAEFLLKQYNSVRQPYGLQGEMAENRNQEI